MARPLRHQLASTSPIHVRGILATVGHPASSVSAPLSELERWLAERHGAAAALLTASGTEALSLALWVAAEMEGGAGRVLLPAYSCFDLASAAVWARRRVGFYDLDPRTLGPDPASLARALSQEGGTVVVAPLFGVPVDWALLTPVIGEGRALVVEDAAQGHGASWGEAPLGSRGRLGVLSFARGKGWTGAGGGALLLKRAEDRERWLESLRSRLGKGPRGIVLKAGAQWALGRPGIYGLPRALPFLGLGETVYRPPLAPRRMSRASARLLLATRTAAEREAGLRKTRGREFAEGLRDRRGMALIPIPEGGSPGYIRFPLLLPNGMASLPDPMAAMRLGMAPGYPVPLPSLQPLEPLVPVGERHSRWPGSETLVRSLVTLPTHGQVTNQEFQRILEALGGVRAPKGG